MFYTESIDISYDLDSIVESYNEDFEALMEMDYLASQYQDEYFTEDAQAINESIFEEIKNRLIQLVTNAKNRISAVANSALKSIKEKIKSIKESEEESVQEAKFGVGRKIATKVSSTPPYITVEDFDKEMVKIVRLLKKAAVTTITNIKDFVYKHCKALVDYVKGKVSTHESFESLTEAGFTKQAAEAIKKKIEQIRKIGAKGLDQCKSVLGSVKGKASSSFHKLYSYIINLISRASIKAIKDAVKGKFA